MDTVFEIATDCYELCGLEIKRGYFVFRDKETREIVGVSSGESRDFLLFVYSLVGDKWETYWESESNGSKFPVDEVIGIICSMKDMEKFNEAKLEAGKCDKGKLASDKTIFLKGDNGVIICRYEKTEVLGVYAIYPNGGHVKDGYAVIIK